MIKKIKNETLFIMEFAIDDFKQKYAGSVVGALWAFAQPMITVLLYWFVFQMGFKSKPVADFPFILWLIAGLIPWFFMSEAVLNATSCLVDYSYLVKKMVFNINILPLAKIVSVLYVQFALIIFMIIFYMVFGYFPNINYIRILPALVYMFVLVTGISYITATLFAFFKDVIQIVSVIIQAVFWMTPIVWTSDIIPETVRKILALNPVSYFVSEYRNALVYNGLKPVEWYMVIYYWGVAIVILVIGLLLFRRCKKHFADVL